MNRLLTIATALLLALTAPAHAHRLDEYLQATILSIQGTHVEGFMRLVPGVAVSSIVISSIDTNGDGTLSEPEQQVYALRVLGDLSLSIDGRPAALHLGSAHFPSLDEMREGMGEIRLDFTADLPRGGPNRKLVFENHHQSWISAYLVNSLVPSDKAIRITAQSRNQNQSLYQLDFAQADGGAGLPPAPHASLPRLSGFEGAFRLGARHIAEGTDHLLFLLVLLLPAPLLACGARWAQCATIRGSLLQITKIVTAFTLGHSVTLGLGGMWVGACAKPSNRGADRGLYSCLRPSCYTPALSGPGSRHRGLLWAHPRLGICNGPERSWLRPVVSGWSAYWASTSASRRCS